ncbi:240_t:CDS:2 [Entrophospora sp. SA101]|nr:240_t:CDS:2 [Entrophospora sp. SA101]
MATTATPIEAMQVIGPEIAKISNFVGQETPDDFIRKIAQVLSSVWAWSTDGNVVAGNRANASINPALHLNILKSKMGGQFATVPDNIPADFPINANQDIDSDVHFITWLNEKFKRETIGTMQSALSGLMQEKFTAFDTPDSYERKVHPYLIGFVQNDPNIINILLGHLPNDLFNRMENAGPANINVFFTTLKNLWMKQKPESSLAKNPQFTQFYHQPDQNIAPQPFQNIVPQPIQNITPQAVQQLVQSTYYKVDPKAYVEDTYGPGTWALDKRGLDTYNMTRGIINCGKNILKHNQDIGILETLPRKLYIDNEENRPDDPMDIDYILYNLSRQLPMDNTEYEEICEDDEDESEDEIPKKKIVTWDVYETDMKELKKVLEYLITIVKNPSHENTSLNEQQPVENASNIQPAIEIIPSAVLDSSANCSIMSLNITKKLGLDIDTSRTTSLEGVATESDTIGWVYNIPVSVGFFTLLNDFIVVDDNKPALLLGTPWLDKAQAIIDFQSRILYIRNSNDLLFNVPISVHKSNDKKKS